LSWLNLLLGAFNLLPALPMDGGRVLRAILARRRSHLEATILAARIARYVGVAMIIIGFIYDVTHADRVLGALGRQGGRRSRSAPSTPREPP
ncbi:MAG TPA: site-2 protease family protein, partial [Acidimicrobiales bacterium]|nr:site-2 protease family protein [Acidimicrobiales bacterium]